MSAHPQLTKENATEMVNYIMTLSTKKTDVVLPQQGLATLDKHMANPDQGRYIITAGYTDKGGVNAPALTTVESLVLRPLKVQAEDADYYSNCSESGDVVAGINHRSYIMYRNVDLKNVTELTFRYASRNRDGVIEVHTDSPKGTLIGKLDFTATGSWRNNVEKTISLTATTGRHNLYFVFVKKERP